MGAWLKLLRLLRLRGRDGARLVLQRGLRGGDEAFESGFIGHGDVGQDLAVEIDSGGLEAFHEAAVGEPVGAGGGVDARLPESAEIAFARLAVTVGPDLGFHDRVLRVAEQFRAATAEALGLLEKDLAAFPARRRVGSSWHRMTGWLLLLARCSLGC